MKKMKFLAILLCFVLILGTTAGCGSVNQDEPQRNVLEEEFNAEEELPSLEVESQGPGGVIGGEVEAPTVEGIQYDAKYQKDMNIDPEEFAGKTLTIWTWWDVDPEDNKDFEEATGAKVVVVNKPWETYGSDLIRGIAAGEGPDICYFGPEIIPSYVKKGYITPISDYLDFNEVQFDLSQSDMEYYTFNGKLYAMPDAGASSSKMYFRKDIFANASLPNPYELYLAGEWTWDRFVRLSQDVKQDLDGDGEFDIWGYYSWQWDVVFFSNGANYVQWVDGNPVEGLSDPKAIQAMEWQRALSEQYDIIAPWDPDNDPIGMLVKGSIAMTYWGDWLVEGLRDELGDKLGIAPFPIGPGAVNPMGDSAAGTREGIAGFCSEPELAALYLLFKRLPADEEAEAAQKAEDDERNIRVYGSAEEYEMAIQMANYAVINPVSGFTGLSDVVGAIQDRSDMTPAQAVESFKHVAQSRIDDTWNQ